MKFENIHSVYFLGIGGIGMSALAKWFKIAGKAVYGYDRVSTPLTDQLISQGIDIHFEDDSELIPVGIKTNSKTSLIIYTPAIPLGHKEKNWFIDNNYKLFKRAEILGLISSEFPTIAVAGTHGKTSVTSMIAHLLHSSGRNITAFVGGMMKNYNSNVIIGNINSKGHWVLAEADEFDRSFLQLQPNLSVITSAEADHLDIYGEEENLKESFRDFARKIKNKGKIYIQSRFLNDFSGLKDINISDYGIESGEIKATELRVENGHFVFNYSDKEGFIKDLELQIPGFHNVENALAAIAISRNFELSEDEIRDGIKSYAGVSRRFEIVVRNKNVIYIDDYAHHPTEIAVLLKSVKHIYPDKLITAIFQPHLYTRTRDFAKGFSESLGLADRVILLPIYPARELPIQGIESEMLLKNIQIDDKACMSKEQALTEVREINNGILLTIGAGDIDQIVKKIKTILDD